MGRNTKKKQQQQLIEIGQQIIASATGSAQAPVSGAVSGIVSSRSEQSQSASMNRGSANPHVPTFISASAPPIVHPDVIPVPMDVDHGNGSVSGSDSDSEPDNEDMSKMLKMFTKMMGKSSKKKKRSSSSKKKVNVIPPARPVVNSFNDNASMMSTSSMASIQSKLSDTERKLKKHKKKNAKMTKQILKDDPCTCKAGAPCSFAQCRCRVAGRPCGPLCGCQHTHAGCHQPHTRKAMKKLYGKVPKGGLRNKDFKRHPSYVSDSSSSSSSSDSSSDSD